MSRVIWKDEDEDENGEGVGPVWVETGDDPGNPDTSEEWPEWVRRSVAEKYATDHGYEFIPDE